MSATGSVLPPPADLAGATILAIIPRFFTYHNDIAEELRRRGATVDLLEDRPFASPVMHAAARFTPGAVQRLILGQYRQAIAGAGRAQYDIVLIVNGQTVAPELLRHLRAQHPTASFIYYLWDSLSNRGGAAALMPMMDRCYTFEPEAAQITGARLRPLFFAPRFAAASDDTTNPRHDISFIGTAHSDRYQVVTALDALLPADIDRFWFLYLKAPWVHRAYAMTNPAFRGAPRSAFSFEPMSHQESARHFWGSTAILDVEHERQTGLTIRTFETLGAGKKLVTTNRQIAGYAFYDPSWIRVIDRGRIDLAPEFLKSPAPQLDDTTRTRYSLAGWIDEIMDPCDHSAAHLRT